jgi:uncharacterized protein (DUF1697 family)
LIYAAFLRGMNLGNRRITSEDLRAEFERIGLDSPRTFRAAGNVVFESPGRSEAKLIELIESGLEQGLGYSVPTVLRTAREAAAVAAAEPFPPADVAASAGKLQVLLLAASPAATAREAVLARATGEDRLAFGSRELYWLPSGGISDSELDLRGIEKDLPPGTMRTRGTIEQLVARHLT